MRCSRRSTRLFASVSLVLLLLTTPVVAGNGTSPDAAIADAIMRAVRLRMGNATTVVVSSLNGVRLAVASDTLLAVPEPASQLGAPVRFVLSDARPGQTPVRVGEAVAVLEVSAPVVQATRTIARGEKLTASDVAVVKTVLGRQPLRPLLSLDEVIESRATRDISASTVVTRADVAPEPVVRVGDIVRAHAHIGEIDVVGEMVAAESGRKNDVIRVFNQETRHAVRARITARGEVEVVNVR